MTQITKNTLSPQADLLMETTYDYNIIIINLMENNLFVNNVGKN